MSLITETNQQYYQGAQGFRGDGVKLSFETTFDTNLILGSFDPNNVDYALNNFKLYTSTTGLPGSYVEYLTVFTVVNNAITFTAGSEPANGLYIVVQLKILDGGKYGATEAEKAYGQVVEDNYGSYAYTTLNDAIDNFMVGYVGDGKLVQTAKRSDILFHAKRGLQEFSYDTLKSIKSAELTIPASLTLALPQDYVNYVKCSWVDQAGVLHPIYPTNNLTTSPYYTQIQDSTGVPTQDNFGSDIEGTSITQERWHSNSSGDLLNNNLTGINDFSLNLNQNGEFINFQNFGQLYGLDPQYANVNGYFNLNEREGKMSFSSQLVGRLIVLEYISDGLAYDSDTRIPKMAEEALYAHVLHAVISTRANQPEYVVQRLKKERSAKLRNAKIRLSNIKTEEITQVMRGKSKWIKH
jgi:hypothetical protein|tara:strand:- start:7570 stop:8799 length:1230 start_codon:yes stop_codon:yes gene_type:complete